jgi:tRNA(fMet)-specific endonuclease VapC
MGLILDTNFVIAAEREAVRSKPGKAAAFLRKHAGEEFFINFIVAGELACGQSAAEDAAWRRLLRPYALLGWDVEISRHYGALYRELAPKGFLIGTNDLWIAATALRHGMGVVTNNVSEFGRIRDLDVREY